MRGVEVKGNINAIKSKQSSVTGAVFSHLPVCLLVILPTSYIYHVWLKAEPCLPMSNSAQ